MVPVQFERSIRRSFIVVLATLAVGGLGLRAAMQALDVYLKKEPVEMRGDFSTIPSVLGNWKKVGDDVLMDAATIEALGTTKYLTRNYALDGDPSRGVISLHLAYYTGMIDTVPHIPERCWGANGLVQLGDAQLVPLEVAIESQPATDLRNNVATGLPYTTTELTDPVTGVKERVTLPLGDLGLTTSTFQDPRTPRLVQLGGYMFIANGRVTPSTFGVRKLAFNLDDKYAYFCKVQFSVRYPVGDRPATEAFKRQTEEFLRDLLPHLMRRLPDWPTVEAMTRQSAKGAPASAPAPAPAQ